MNVQLTINDREVRVPQGATILDAAEIIGIDIPTMCYLKSYEPSTSCMVCVVRLSDSDELVPACGRLAEDGMVVDTESDYVTEARRAAIELLLSDHLGDCTAPCQTACPAGLDIPLMRNLIAEERLDEAIGVVRRDVVLPAVLGRICNAPCEKVCRRGQLDEPVSICLLKRFAGDAALHSDNYSPTGYEELSGKKVAVIGAGLAGLSAAFYLRQKGHAITVFDDHKKPGGMIRYGMAQDRLPHDVLDAEVDAVMGNGIDFTAKTMVGEDILFEDVQKEYDAVFVATGRAGADAGDVFGLPVGKKGIEVKKGTFETDAEGVFAGGDVVRNRRRAVRSIADGKETARAIDLYLTGREVSAPGRRFNSRVGELKCGEETPELFGASPAPRHEAERKGGLTAVQAREEARRCLHCECLKPESCKLRDMAERYGAKSGRYPAQGRVLFSRSTDHDKVVYEPGKCIKCGLCVQISQESGEETGVSFIGRGLHVQVDVPFKRSIKEALRKSGEKCAECCPTGALALKIK